MYIPKSQLGNIFVSFGMENVAIFMTILNILQPFVMFYVLPLGNYMRAHLVYFPRFGIFSQEKPGSRYMKPCD
jgi:hypothetical protein